MMNWKMGGKEIEGKKKTLSFLALMVCLRIFKPNSILIRKAIFPDYSALSLKIE